MKQNKLLPAAVLATAIASAFAANSAFAQSNVQVYGLMDAGVEYLTKAGANKSNMWKVTSGGLNTSRWGIRGSEDLGGGTKALFNLEGGIFLDTGTQDGVLFKRAAVVGLENAYGSVLIGHAFTTVYDFMIAYDPMSYSPNYSWVLAGSATGVSKYGITSSFDNLVKYQGKFGDFKIGATMGLGEQAEGQASSRKFALGGNYASGPMGLVVTYERINGNMVAPTGNRDATKAIHLAGSYVIGDYKAIIGARDYKLAAGKPATAELQARTYWAGLAYKLTPAATIIGAAYYQDVRNVAPNQDADPLMIVLRAKYAMSVRTDLYTTIGHVKSENGKGTGLSRDEASCGCVTSQNGVTVGIQHRF
jgi:predicted porin